MGIPLFVVEAFVGQYSGLNANIAFRRLCPILGGLGWNLGVVPYFISFYYAVILAWALRYIFAAFYANLRWANCGLEELGYMFNTESKS